MQIREFVKGQEKQISEMIWSVFEKFDAPDYPEKGIKNFKDFIDAEHLREMVQNEGVKIYCFYDRQQLAGVIAMREKSHISLLFVKEEFHRQGIAKQLIQHIIKELKISRIKRITVNASPYAEKIYRRMGFDNYLSLQEKDGIRFVPMLKEI